MGFDASEIPIEYEKFAKSKVASIEGIKPHAATKLWFTSLSINSEGVMTMALASEKEAEGLDRGLSLVTSPKPKQVKSFSDDEKPYRVGDLPFPIQEAVLMDAAEHFSIPKVNLYEAIYKTMGMSSSEFMADSRKWLGYTGSDLPLHLFSASSGLHALERSDEEEQIARKAHHEGFVRHLVSLGFNHDTALAEYRDLEESGLPNDLSDPALDAELWISF